MSPQAENFDMGNSPLEMENPLINQEAGKADFPFSDGDLFNGEPGAPTKEWNFGGDLSDIDLEQANGDFDLGSDFFIDDLAKKQEDINYIGNPSPAPESYLNEPFGLGSPLSNFPAEVGANDATIAVSSSDAMPVSEDFVPRHITPLLILEIILLMMGGLLRQRKNPESAEKRKSIGETMERIKKSQSRIRRSQAPLKPRETMFLYAVLGLLVLVLLLVVLYIAFIQNAKKTSDSSQAESPAIVENNQPNLPVPADKKLDKSNNSTEQNLNTAQMSIPQRQELYTKGVQAYKDENFEVALANFKKLLNVDANYQDARVYKSACYLELDYIDKAQQEAQISIQNAQPQTHFAYWIIGRCKEKKQDYQEAIADYDKALAHDPKYTPAIKGKSRSYRQRGNLVMALKFATEAINAGDPSAYSELVATRSAVVDKISALTPQENLSLLKNAINYDPEFPDYYIVITQLVWEQSPKEALDAAEKYLQLKKNIASSRYYS